MILVTATPYNNSKGHFEPDQAIPKRQKGPCEPPDLEKFFSGLDKKLKDLDRQRDHANYIKVVGITPRKSETRFSNTLWFAGHVPKFWLLPEDVKKQNLKFPDVADPEPAFYELNETEDEIFTRTVELVVKQFTYARYMPMLYYKGEVSHRKLFPRETWEGL